MSDAASSDGVVSRAIEALELESPKEREKRLNRLLENGSIELHEASQIRDRFMSDKE